MAMAIASRHLCNFPSFFLPSPRTPTPKQPHPTSLHPFPPPPRSITASSTTAKPWRHFPTLDDDDYDVDDMSFELLQATCPALAVANVLWFKAGYNMQIAVGEHESEEVLLRRFWREVMKAGILQECKRRRWFEDKPTRLKRKARAAARRNRRFKRRPWSKEEPTKVADKKEEKVVEEEDNWEYQEVDLPYC